MAQLIAIKLKKLKQTNKTKQQQQKKPQKTNKQTINKKQNKKQPETAQHYDVLDVIVRQIYKLYLHRHFPSQFHIKCFK